MEKNSEGRNNKKKVIGIINYGFGNIPSLKNALDYLGYKSVIINKPENPKKYTHIMLPGDGFFPKAAEVLRKKKWDSFIKNALNEDKKLLGICVGMQLLFSHSSEGSGSEGLGIIKGNCDKFNNNKNYSIPHIGFNFVNFNNFNYEFKKNTGYFYFIHSFRVKKIREKDILIANSFYGEEFVAFINKKNIFGAQFHPEKSGIHGLSLIKNFLDC
jgi:glutamine amidotransferase